jgi:hypothetical protein
LHAAPPRAAPTRPSAKNCKIYRSLLPPPAIAVKTADLLPQKAGLAAVAGTAFALGAAMNTALA